MISSQKVQHICSTTCFYYNNVHYIFGHKMCIPDLSFGMMFIVYYYLLRVCIGVLNLVHFSLVVTKIKCNTFIFIIIIFILNTLIIPQQPLLLNFQNQTINSIVLFCRVDRNWREQTQCCLISKTTLAFPVPFLVTRATYNRLAVTIETVTSCKGCNRYNEPCTGSIPFGTVIIDHNIKS